MVSVRKGHVFGSHANPNLPPIFSITPTLLQAEAGALDGQNGHGTYSLDASDGGSGGGVVGGDDRSRTDPLLSVEHTEVLGLNTEISEERVLGIFEIRHVGDSDLQMRLFFRSSRARGTELCKASTRPTPTLLR